MFKNLSELIEESVDEASENGLTLFVESLTDYEKKQSIINEHGLEKTVKRIINESSDDDDDDEIDDLSDDDDDIIDFDLGDD